MPERARTRHLGGGASGAFIDPSYAALGACVTGGTCSSAGLLLGVARATNPKSPRVQIGRALVGRDAGAPPERGERRLPARNHRIPRPTRVANGVLLA